METTNLSHTAIKVTLAQRGLEAWARIVPPRPVDPEEIRLALAHHGVREGIDEDVLRTLAEFPPDEEVLIARGQPPVNGEPARIDYFFLSDLKSGPMVDDQGRADFREVSVIQNVTPGQLIARKTPPTQGYPGRAVNGEPIPPVPGKDVNLLAGKNVELSANKLEAFSLVMGIPKLVKNRVAVLPVFQVNDVDFSVGNINFQGSVLIRGNVNPGFSVKATEDVSVEGNVENAVIESGGSIKVRGGARSGARLSALKDVVVRFCDSNSTLSAGHLLHVKGDAIQCDLHSRHTIQVDQHMIGGTARAAELIQVMDAGSHAEAPTRLDLVQDGDKDQIEKLKDDISSLEGDLEGIATLIQQLMSKERPEEGNISLQKLMPVKVNMNIRLAQLRTQLKELTERQDALEPPRLVVKGEAYPGVLIHFQTAQGTRSMRLNAKQYAKTYSFVDGEIQD